MHKKIAIGLAIIIVILLILNALCLTGVFSKDNSDNNGNLAMTNRKANGKVNGKANGKVNGKNVQEDARGRRARVPLQKPYVYKQNECLNSGIFNGNKTPDPAMFPCTIR